MGDNSLKDILNLVLVEEVKSGAEDWLKGANKDEKKGLKLIGAIYRHKGKKRFRNEGDETRNSARGIKSAASELRKRQLMSTYESSFSGPRAQSIQTIIFDYKKLADLECSWVLTKVAVMFIQNWLDLKDSKNYQELILGCLRSLSAILRKSKAATENANAFNWKDPSKNYKSQRTDHLNSAVMGIRSSSANRPWIRPQTTPTADRNAKASVLTKEDLMKRKQALIKGSGQIGKWVVSPSNPHVSHYQQTFTTHFHNYQKPLSPDIHTSISLGRLCPNPDQLMRK